jgi:hypothetical protein
MLPVLLLATLGVTPVESPSSSGPTRLAVTPMAAPKPVMRYQLLPEVRELTAGNPVQWYMRCFAEQRFFFFGKEGVAQRERYRSLPLAELPGEELRNYGGSALTQADWGARLDTPNWEAVERVQIGTTDQKWPELGPLRLLGESLQVRLRGEVARRDYEGAIRTFKTMFALARHLGEHPTTAANLLGVSIAQLALDTMDEMLVQPGCPNLYWALTDLPCPLVDIRKGAQGDRTLTDGELRPLRDDDAMKPEEIEELVGRLSGRLGYVRVQSGRPPRGLRQQIAERLKDTAAIGLARRRLLEAMPADGAMQKVGTLRVLAYPDVQVVLLDEKRKFEQARDEQMKLLTLAPWQIDAMNVGSSDAGLFGDFLPQLLDARRTQAHLEQRLALLRHVEALRLYAAAHDGQLPASLGETKLPLPADPFTGKAFEYKGDGTTATLRGGAPKGEEGLAYEITIRK